MSDVMLLLSSVLVWGGDEATTWSAVRMSLMYFAHIGTYTAQHVLQQKEGHCLFFWI